MTIDVKKQYRYWRIRIMYSLMIGYGAFYITRLNFSMVMPEFLREFSLSTSDLGVVLSLFSIIYGIGKFINGIFADRSNPRYFMSVGLIFTGIISISLGFSAGFVSISLLWLLNAWAQSMGWPPCARSMTKWYAPQKRGFMWGIWNSSHQIGGIIALVGTGYIIQYFNWRWAFIIPGIVVIFFAFLIMNRLRDTPQSLGLPNLHEYEPEAYQNKEVEKIKSTTKEIFLEHILPNKTLWCLCFANFFVYIVRIGILTWGPLFLLNMKHVNIVEAGWSSASFEFAGIFGAIIAGFFSDKLFKGRRGPVNVLFSAVVTLGLLGFMIIPANSFMLSCGILAVIGFMIYGPQMLVGVAAADTAGSNASATATGLTGTFGYLGTAVCNVVIGVIVASWGWNAGIVFFIISGIVATILFIPTWNAKPR